jgi:hypothetical protein
MGYLEPRPSSQSPPDKDHLPSPKEIQRHLMERVNCLGPDSNVEEISGEGEGERGGEGEGEKAVKSAIRSSQSSQSLNSNGGSVGSKRISFASIFR